jgi:hypothetical protein
LRHTARDSGPRSARWGATALWALSTLGTVACASEPEFTPLFRGDRFDGWYSFLPSHGVDSDPLGIFKIEDGVVHLLDVDTAQPGLEFGYLATRREYGDFHLRLEYRFGEKQFVGFKDSGFFIHAVGPDMIWPRSQECQVMVGDSGSMYMFDYATVETTIDPANPDPTYLEGGVPYTTPRSANPFYPRVTHSMGFDSPTEWNTVEIIAIGETTELLVNGNVTFRSTARRQPSPDVPDDPAMDIPLTRGRLVLQEEGAEIFYRNVEVKELDP